MPGISPQLVLDQGLPRDATEILRASGIGCVRVAELGMSAAEDPEILEWAGLRHYVVVTLDADFHAILSLKQRRRPIGNSYPSAGGPDGTAVADLIAPIIGPYAACKAF